MERKRKAAAGILLLLLIAVWFGAQQMSVPEHIENPLCTVTALSVGKADALIVKTEDWAALIDTGESKDGEVIRTALEEQGIQHLNLLLITHFDKDHVGSAAWILETVGVDQVLMPDYEGSRPEYQEFLKVLHEQKETTVLRVTEPMTFSQGGLDWTLYTADDTEAIFNAEQEYDNDLSLVASMTCGERRFLFTGDIEKTRIGQMLDSDVDWHHDWIKMPHHGRYQKKLEELLDAVQPETAVICDGQEQPAEDKTKKALRKRYVEEWDTSNGTVMTVTDGVKIEIRQEMKKS